MQLPGIQLPDMSRIRIITHYDDMVVAMDREKAEISRKGFEKPMHERDAVVDELAEICERQAPLTVKGQEIRSTVVLLTEMGAYWLALVSLFSDEADKIKRRLDPAVQKMREASAGQETVQ